MELHIIIVGIFITIIAYVAGNYQGFKKAEITKGHQNTIHELEAKEEELRQKHKDLNDNNKNLEVALKELRENEKTLTEKLKLLKEEESQVLCLKGKSDFIKKDIEGDQKTLAKIKDDIKEKQLKLSEILRKDDLYSRIDEFVEYGHFEKPEYIYEVSESFAEAIKIVRNKQKQMISDKNVVIFPKNTILSKYTSLNTKIINNTIKLMLRTYNIECDTLINKTTPSNFSRTIERIIKLASDIEKIALTLEIEFSDQYIELKTEECELMYQYKLKKQEEKEEQQLLREQMREEQKAMAEYQKAIDDAKKEEELYDRLLEKAKKEFEYATSEEKELARAKITELENQLAEAIENSKRAQSMAELTKKGHIYIISNIGSFGENVYKIGMTRRLDPMDRVKELGDASVPFRFDVHAIISCDDAPAVENQLHKYFSNKRVNMVNYRKEFFKTTLEEIKKALDTIIKHEYDFRTTIVAEEYYESRRLLPN